MRRILVDTARRRNSQKHGGDHLKQKLNAEEVVAPQIGRDILALDEALDKLADTDSQVAELVKLRFFAGLTNKQAAQLLDISPRTADNYWAYAKAWLLEEIEGAAC